MLSNSQNHSMNMPHQQFWLIPWEAYFNFFERVNLLSHSSRQHIYQNKRECSRNLKKPGEAKYFLYRISDLDQHIFVGYQLRYRNFATLPVQDVAVQTEIKLCLFSIQISTSPYQFPPYLLSMGSSFKWPPFVIEKKSSQPFGFHNRICHVRSRSCMS